MTGTIRKHSGFTHPIAPRELFDDEADLVQQIGDQKDVALNLVEQLYAELASKGEVL